MGSEKREIGCGLWLIWLLLATFAGEWLLLWFVVRALPQELLLPAVMGVITATIVGGSATLYFRVQRRMR